MISRALNCMTSGPRLLQTLAVAARSFARLSSLTWLATGVMTILAASRLNETSLPGATPATSRMCETRERKGPDSRLSRHRAKPEPAMQYQCNPPENMTLVPFDLFGPGTGSFRLYAVLSGT